MISPPENTFAIVICSKGRPAILTETVRSLRRQSVQAAQLLLVVTGPDDVDRESLAGLGIPNLEVLFSEPGAARQRNVGIERLAPGTEYACFFDDDMELQRDYIRHALQFLGQVPTVMALSGRMLRESCADRAEASALVEAFDPAADRQFAGEFRNRGRHWVLHGCNMVIRTAVLAYERFDERLPRYSYAEDYDLSVRIRHYGYVGRLARCVGVHLQTASGRVNGKQVGYSQVANNWYFLQKGVSHLSYPASHIRFTYITARLMIGHLFGSLRGLDRQGAALLLRGNLLAVRDIIAGKSAPERILDLP
jgi:GT2 family glycosyltransferase